MSPHYNDELRVLIVICINYMGVIPEVFFFSGDNDHFDWSITRKKKQWSLPIIKCSILKYGVALLWPLLQGPIEQL